MTGPRRRRPIQAQAATTPVKLSDVIPNLGPEQGDPPGPATAGEDATSSPKRRRRASVGGHAMKLKADARPGFTRRFFNDDGNRLAAAEDLGYTVVTDTKAKSPGLGSADSRLAGTKANGEPLRAVLMETPDELYAEGVAEREAINSQVDQAIVKGADFTGQVTSDDNTYGRGSIHVER
jgi:hypothetical protein